jgi:transposase
MPRRTKLTPEIQRKICEALASGNYFETACRYVGIDVSTGKQWLQRGRGQHKSRGSKAIYVAFVAAVEKAIAEDEIATIAQIKLRGRGRELVSEDIHREPDVIITKLNGDIEERKGEQHIKRLYTRPEWTADAWRMERKYPHRWGRKERLDVHIFVQEEVERIQHDLALTEDEKQQLIHDITEYAYGRAQS